MTPREYRAMIDCQRAEEELGADEELPELLYNDMEIDTLLMVGQVLHLPNLTQFVNFTVPECAE